MAVTPTFINSASSSTDATSYDFGNFNAAEDGLMVVGGAVPGGDEFLSISIGGSSGTEVVQTNDGDGDVHCGIFAREVSSGNRNVTANPNGSRSWCAAAVWLLTGYESATAFSVSQADLSAGGTSIIAEDLDIPANGAAIYIHAHAQASTVTWSSATEAADLSPEAGYQVSGAHKTSASELLNHDETASWTGSVTRAIAGAAWAPVGASGQHRMFLVF